MTETRTDTETSSRQVDAQDKFVFAAEHQSGTFSRVVVPVPLSRSFVSIEQTNGDGERGKTMIRMFFKLLIRVSSRHREACRNEQGEREKRRERERDVNSSP
jgi:hypothetical protein